MFQIPSSCLNAPYDASDAEFHLINVLYFGRFYHGAQLRFLISIVLLHRRRRHLLTAKYSASLSKILTCVAINPMLSSVVFFKLVLVVSDG